MRSRYTISLATTLGALLGSWLAACLPDMPDGERSTQCWTNHSIARSECDQALIWCLADATHVDDTDECFADADRCYVQAFEKVKQCERRFGCFEDWDACDEECQLVADGLAGGCQRECQLELELCAPWLALDCEQACSEDRSRCSDGARFPYELVRCEGAQIDCILGCYGRDSADDREDGDDCDPGETTCSLNQLRACEDGRFSRSYSCGDICRAGALDSAGCDDHTCRCIEPPGGTPVSDQTCDLGATAYCFCSELAGMPCNEDDQFYYYQYCLQQPTTPYECMASYVVDGTIDCEAATAACICSSANNGVCDEPEGTGSCSEGSDINDC
jgi:hypothetical protein